MAQELFLTATSLEASPPADSNELGTMLEKCSFRDRVLQGAYLRYYEECEGAPLGLSWAGILQYIISPGKQVKAVSKAILAAFGGKEVQVRVKSRRGEVSIHTRNTNLDEVMQLVQSVMDPLLE